VTAVGWRDVSCFIRALQVWEDVKATPHYREEKALKPVGDLTERGGLSSARRHRVVAPEDK
jgi:hypothetical protein